MDILAFASFAVLVVVWLVAPTKSSVPSVATENIEAPESVTVAA
jgi:hypothetical protein